MIASFVVVVVVDVVVDVVAQDVRGYTGRRSLKRALDELNDVRPEGPMPLLRVQPTASYGSSCAR